MIYFVELYILLLLFNFVEREKRREIYLENTRSLTDTQEKIVQAAFPLFAKNGFKSTTTKEIARASGVNESTLFKNFSNKREIFEIAKQGESLQFQTELTQIFEKNYSDLSSLLTEGGRQLFFLFLQHHNLVSIFFRELDNEELSVGRNTVFEASANALMQSLSRMTNHPAEPYAAPTFQLISSLLCLSLNEANNRVLTDELEVPVSVDDLCKMTVRLLTTEF